MPSSGRIAAMGFVKQMVSLPGLTVMPHAAKTLTAAVHAPKNRATCAIVLICIGASRDASYKDRESATRRFDPAEGQEETLVIERECEKCMNIIGKGEELVKEIETKLSQDSDTPAPS